LRDKDGPERKALGGDETLGGNLSLPIKDAFEMLMKIFMAMERSL